MMNNDVYIVLKNIMHKIDMEMICMEFNGVWKYAITCEKEGVKKYLCNDGFKLFPHKNTVILFNTKIELDSYIEQEHKNLQILHKRYSKRSDKLESIQINSNLNNSLLKAIADPANKIGFIKILKFNNHK